VHALLGRFDEREERIANRTKGQQSNLSERTIAFHFYQSQLMPMTNHLLSRKFHKDHVEFQKLVFYS